MWETWVRSLGQEDPLEKEMATHSSILAWAIPWTEKLGGPSSWRRKELDTTEWLHFLSFFHEGQTGEQWLETVLFIKLSWFSVVYLRNGDLLKNIKHFKSLFLGSDLIRDDVSYLPCLQPPPLPLVTRATPGMQTAEKTCLLRYSGRGHQCR